MRKINAKTFMGYLQNAWLAGMTMNEVLREIICIHDIEVTPQMETALAMFFERRNSRINAFIPTLHSEMKGH